MSETIRSFIAVKAPDQIQNSLMELIHQLKTTGADIKWVAPGNIHLTVKFLGEVERKKIKIIRENLPGYVAGMTAFDVPLVTVGAFPGLESPQIIWAGNETMPAEMKQLFKNVETGLAVLGFAKERRPFSVHLTLGRVRSSRQIKSLSDTLKNFSFPPGLTFHVDHLTLFQSTLTPRGAVYEPLQTVTLPSAT